MTPITFIHVSGNGSYSGPIFNRLDVGSVYCVEASLTQNNATHLAVVRSTDGTLIFIGLQDDQKPLEVGKYYLAKNDTPSHEVLLEPFSTNK